MGIDMLRESLDIIAGVGSKTVCTRDKALMYGMNLLSDLSEIEVAFHQLGRGISPDVSMRLDYVLRYLSHGDKFAVRLGDGVLPADEVSVLKVKEVEVDLLANHEAWDKKKGDKKMIGTDSTPHEIDPTEAGEKWKGEKGSVSKSTEVKKLPKF